MAESKSIGFAGLWPLVVPFAAWALYLPVGGKPEGALVALLFAVLIAAVFAAVHHAEVIAHRVGEPFGTLVLAAAVTVIEASLIISIMLSGEGDHATLARDTLFATVMIVVNGIVGLCIIVGGLRHGTQGFEVKGAAAFLAVLITVATLTMVLPITTRSTAGPVFTAGQLVLVGAVSLVLYGVFLFVQTVRHRDYFLPAEGADDEDTHAPAPSTRSALLSGGLLVVALGAVVLLAKALSYPIEAGISELGVAQPKALVGAIVAALVLLPEGMAAVQAARRNRLQTSLNLALGSALASISLTIPAVGAVSLWLDQPFVLGLDAKDVVLLVLTFVIATLTLGGGRTNVLHGAVHLVIFAVFGYLLVVP